MAKLTDRQVRNLTGPSDEKAYTIFYDGPDGVRGFGIRVTKGGAKSWILNYRSRGIERRLTIGSFPDWSVVQARTEAMRLKRLVDQGQDPQAERAAQRGAPTMNQALDRYVAEYLPRLREGSQRQYLALIRQWLRPELGTRKLADIRHSDVEKLHRKITAGAPVRANRTMTLLSRVFALSIKWEMRLDNPVKGLERNPEEPRTRYLSAAEFGRLAAALAAFPDQCITDAVRLLCLTGARKGEVFGMEWSQIDTEAATWVKPASFVKQKKLHRVPLSDAALAIVVRIKEAQEAAGVVSPYVFPWPTRSGHLAEIWRQWAEICKAAEITGLRVHDCRHSFASELVSAGFGLPLIGKLLGHSQISTTQRYSHLYDEPQRVAVERVGARISGNGNRGDGPEAEVVEIGAARR
jgi:integrase